MLATKISGPDLAAWACSTVVASRLHSSGFQDESVDVGEYQSLFASPTRPGGQEHHPAGPTDVHFRGGHPKLLLGTAAHPISLFIPEAAVCGVVRKEIAVMRVVWLSDKFFAGAAFVAADRGGRRVRQHKRDGEEKTGDNKVLSHQETSAEFCKLASGTTPLPRRTTSKLWANQSPGTTLWRARGPRSRCLAGTSTLVGWTNPKQRFISP